ncbi:MAG: hypothetical protein FK733_10865 [Asgard group archaeon]|nr:hypothetical protein [Asgard group archaeon]
MFFSPSRDTFRIYIYWMEDISTRMISSISRDNQCSRDSAFPGNCQITWYKKNFKSEIWFSCIDVSMVSPQETIDFGAIINGGSITND